MIDLFSLEDKLEIDQMIDYECFSNKDDIKICTVL